MNNNIILGSLAGAMIYLIYKTTNVKSVQDILLENMSELKNSISDIDDRLSKNTKIDSKEMMKLFLEEIASSDKETGKAFYELWNKHYPNDRIE